METLLLQILYTFIAIIGANIYGMMAAGIVYVTMARVVGRIGPPLYQPFLDWGRSMAVRTSISHGPMFYFGPVIRATGGIGILVLMPIIYDWGPGSNFSFSGDLILILYLMFFGSLGMALGAATGGQPNSPIGASRGLAQMVSFELPFNFAIVALIASSNSFSVVDIVAAQQGGIMNWNVFQQPLATLAALIAMLGMNMYSPFNIVGAYNEIPIGPRTEYQGGYLSTLRLGASVFVIAKMILFINLFFGGTTVPHPDGWNAILVGLAIGEMAAKVLAVYMISIFVGAVFPRFRTDQSIDFFLRWPSLIGVAAVLVVMI